jgi:LmbE family N-acetylglucosaminyl deacetylase
MAVPARNPVLIVSPHPDDAVLSCFALLARDEAVDVLDVFVGSPDPPRQGVWDARCGFADSREMVEVRRREELAAFGGTPHRVEFMDLPDWQYVDGHRPETDRATLVRALADRVRERRPATVALPAGAGWTMTWLRRWLGERVWWRFIGKRPGPPRQVDHVFARDAALSFLAGTPDVSILLYEELPYLWGAPADREVERAASRAGLRAEPFSLPVDRERKATAIAAYASQVEHISPPHGRVDDPDVLPPTERYWRLA